MNFNNSSLYEIQKLDRNQNFYELTIFSFQITPENKLKHFRITSVSLVMEVHTFVRAAIISVCA